jgi:hypothetical protein
VALGVMRDELLHDGFNNVIGRDHCGGPGRFLLGAGVFAFYNLVPGLPRPLPCRLEADRGILADREFARLAGRSISESPRQFPGGLNDEIKPANATVRDLPPRWTRLEFFKRNRGKFLAISDTRWKRPPRVASAWRSRYPGVNRGIPRPCLGLSWAVPNCHGVASLNSSECPCFKGLAPASSVTKPDSSGHHHLR